MGFESLTLEEKIKSLEGPIVIFGASGFVGANLLSSILSYRSDCYAISHDTRRAWRLKLLNVPDQNILFCDILFKSALSEIFEKYKPRTVFNLSAYGAYAKQGKVELIHETNYLGTVNILELCKNIKAYVHAGSSSEYGLNAQGPSEISELKPNSHYAVSKVSSSYLIKYYGQILGVPCVNLRLYSVYGPWEEPDRLIPRLIENLHDGKLPPLVNPDISRDFIYTDDCVSAFIHAAYYMSPELAGKSVNIGSGIKTTMRNLVETSLNITGQAITPEWGSMPNRNWDVQDWYGNSELARTLLKWTPEVSLAEGLRKTMRWQGSVDYKKSILQAFKSPEKLSKISCIIACYKDDMAIPIMYERIVKVFAKMGARYEIVFVNDASPDNTQAVLDEICTKDMDVVAITHSRNFGSQSAFQSGMEIATGDAVVLMDGDLQDPPEVISEMFEKWQEGYEVVYGRRVKREASWFMNVSYKLFYRIFRRLSYVSIPQDAGDFSLIDRRVVNELVNLPEKEQFLRGLRAWVGFRQTGVDYVRPERMFGKSTNNWRKNIGWAKKAIFSFSFIPLEFLSYLGFTLTGISFLAVIAQIILRFIYPDTPHGVTTIIVLVLFFGGIQLLAISVLGEYLSKIFEETKGRPKFIRKQVIHKGRKLELPSEIHNLVKR